MNPWLLEEGSGGSSAGPGAATAAALVGLLDRQRDGGQHRRPVDALRRDGAAADLRPGAADRRDDALLVARQARADDARRRGHDARPRGDLRARTRATSRACRAASTSTRNGAVQGLKVGFFPAWMNESPATEVDRAALETVRAPRDDAGRGEPAGLAVRLAQHDPLRRGGRGLRGADALARPRPAQDAGPDAWPNTFRQSRFLSAVDFVQADRLRRKVAQEMARLFEKVGPAPRPRAARRDPDDHELHRAPRARRFPRVSSRSTQARSDWAPDPAHPLPDLSPEAPRAARRVARRPALRRGDDRIGRDRARAGLRRRPGAAARLLTPARGCNRLSAASDEKGDSRA